MPTPAQLTVATIREQIKKEARINGSDNLDTWIVELINELLLDYIEKNRYFELLTTNYSIATVSATGNYNLPTDFFHERLVRYQAVNGSPFTLRPRNEYVENPRGTMPRFYEVAGTTLNIFPFDNVPDDDAVLLDYFKYPQTLTTTDVFPIPRLLPTLKLRAIHRVLVFDNELQAAAAIKGESLEMDFKVRPNAHPY